MFARLAKLKQRWETSTQRRWTATTILADADPYIDALEAEVARLTAERDDLRRRLREVTGEEL